MDIKGTELFLHKKIEANPNTQDVLKINVLVGKDELSSWLKMINFEGEKSKDIFLLPHELTNSKQYEL